MPHRRAALLVAVITLCCAAPAQGEEPSIKTVVLDAGHGGYDKGAIGRRHGLLEKDAALAIACKIRPVLEAAGMTVVMTRDRDVFVPLPRRARIANTAGADLFVSIHINSSESRCFRGFECYYLSEASDDRARALEALENAPLKLGGDAVLERSSALDKTLWGMTLAENRIESAGLAAGICRAVEAEVPIENRGVKTADFFVLRHTSVPGVLVEVCYLSNGIDEAKLTAPAFQDKVAAAVARGILRHRDEFERTEGFTKI